MPLTYPLACREGGDSQHPSPPPDLLGGSAKYVGSVSIRLREVEYDFKKESFVVNSFEFFNKMGFLNLILITVKHTCLDCRPPRLVEVSSEYSAP